MLLINWCLDIRKYIYDLKKEGKEKFVFNIYIKANNFNVFN